jgi:hypothetical protein
MTKTLAIMTILFASTAGAQMYGPDAECHALYTGSFQNEIACEQEQQNYRSRVRREKQEEDREWRRRELWREIDRMTLDRERF